MPVSYVRIATNRMDYLATLADRPGNKPNGKRSPIHRDEVGCQSPRKPQSPAGRLIVSRSDTTSSEGQRALPSNLAECFRLGTVHTVRVVACQDERGGFVLCVGKSIVGFLSHAELAGASKAAITRAGRVRVKVCCIDSRQGLMFTRLGL